MSKKLLEKLESERESLIMAHDNMQREISQLKKYRDENKRYREAIEKAIESCCYDAAITDLKKFMESETE